LHECGSWKELEEKHIKEDALYVWVRRVLNTLLDCKAIEIGERNLYMKNT
jgi:hypothetical protein